MVEGEEYGLLQDGKVNRVKFLSLTHSRQMRWGDNWQSHDVWTFNFEKVDDFGKTYALDPISYWDACPNFHTWNWWLETNRVCKFLGVSTYTGSSYWKLKGSSMKKLAQAVHSKGLDNIEVLKLDWPLQTHQRLFGEVHFRITFDEMTLLHSIC